VSGASKIRGYVLAGGASSRFGTDKALAELQGKSMLTRTAELLSAVCSNVAIVAPTDKLLDSSVETILDGWPGEGPLGGILTALLDAKKKDRPDSWNLILSCDMPFLTQEWLEFQCERAKASDAEVIVPRSEHGMEPLCACWRTSALGALQAAFDEGIRKVTEAMKRLRMEILDETHWKRFDSGGQLFWNMNTAQDYQEAVRISQMEKA